MANPIIDLEPRGTVLRFGNQPAFYEREPERRL